MRTLRFIVYNLLSWSTVFFWGCAVILTALFSDKLAYAVARHWCRMVIGFARIICGLRYRVEGKENFGTDSCVIFIKHSSAFETILQLVEFPRSCWVMKRELLWVPGFGWGLRALRAIAIDRSAGRLAVKQVIDQGKERLAEGVCVSVFPEGTRMPAGTTKRYGVSGTLLAQEAGVKIIPVAHNAGYLWPRRGLGIQPGEVVLVVGKPVDPAGRDAREVNDEIQGWVEAKVAEIVAGPS